MIPKLDEALVTQAFRHLAGYDALRQALDDRRLTDARLPDQNGIVLLAASEHLDRRLDLARAADYRVELAFACKLGEITRIFVEVGCVCRRFDLSRLRTAADHLHHLLADRLRRQPIAAQKVASDAFLLLRQPDQEMLRADIRMAELV